MTVGADMAMVARLVGDPARANMLATMLDARAHTAGELAAHAGVTPATASGHLRQLLAGELVAVAAQGRHRYYRLASIEVARMLEGLMRLTPHAAPRPRAAPRIPAELREARTCYDHLAGRLGVAIADRLVSDDAATFEGGAGMIGDRGRALLADLGIDFARAGGSSRRPLCRPCLDWSERRPHLAGVIGSALLDRLLELGWIARTGGSRAVRITPRGIPELARNFDYRASARGAPPTPS